MSSISSRGNATVRSFRELARDPDPEGRRVLLDGVHLIRDAADAGLELDTVAIAASRSDGTEEADLARALRARGAHVVVVADRAFAAMSPVRAPSGIIAIAQRRPVGADDVCRRVGRIALVAADIQDPGNVGALVRAAEAAGIGGVLVCGASANPFSWKALRGSMGSLLRMPVAAGGTVEDAMDGIRRHGGRLVAAAPRGGLDPGAVNWTGPVALVLGGEGAGVSAGVLAMADQLVTIPMAPPVESLNVAVAAGILLYAARAQRQGRGPRPTTPPDDGRAHAGGSGPA